jgi:hypothetical protein
MNPREFVKWKIEQNSILAFFNGASKENFREAGVRGAIYSPGGD